MAQEYMQMVDWNVSDIAQVSAKLVGYYVKNLELVDEKRWIEFMRRDLLWSAMNQSPGQVSLSGDGYELVFNWPEMQRYEINGQAFWSQEDPYFQFTDRSYGYLAPSRRGQLFRTNEDIAREMADVYRMSVSHMPVHRYAFPKTSYAKRVELGRAVLL